MQYPIQTQFFDPQAVLSELDIFQIESMIWLRLAPYKEDVESVRFEIARRGNPEFTWDHTVSVKVELSDGHTCEFETVKVSKAATLMESIRQLEDGVSKRIKFQRGMFYRSLQRLSSVAEPIRSIIRQQNTRAASERETPTSSFESATLDSSKSYGG